MFIEYSLRQESITSLVVIRSLLVTLIAMSVSKLNDAHGCVSNQIFIGVSNIALPLLFHYLGIVSGGRFDVVGILNG